MRLFYVVFKTKSVRPFAATRTLNRVIATHNYIGIGYCMSNSLYNKIDHVSNYNKLGSTHQIDTAYHHNESDQYGVH